MTLRPFESGSFLLGCNYWASHAGTSMWSNWRPDVVEKDLASLSKGGFHALRVFPLWPDFQPLSLLRGHVGHEREYRMGEEPLPDTEAGQAGISEEMIRRFDVFQQLAEKYQLKLIVGLVTGWMSGRLFVPPAFLGQNVLTDPAVLRWQVRFVEYFVRRFSAAESILAWDLGNECNCMAAATRDEAWAWSSAVTHAIRCADPTRPVISGMHSLSPDPTAAWTIQDQAELTDVLTTHPYPIFTPHCDLDPINTIRTILHASAESRMYADVGQTSCLVEEIGTMGPMFAGNREAAGFLRAGLFSAWAHDCHGLFWWCAFKQNHLDFAPYDWSHMERELGMIQADHTPQPFLEEITKFRRFLDTLPYQTLPPRITDAVCILSADQDQWGAAFGAFILAKQAGFDLEFQYEDQTLRPADAYMLPGISGHHVLHHHRWRELLQRVREGAILYVSFSDGFLTSFEEIAGLRIQSRRRRAEAGQAVFSGLEGKPTLSAPGPIRLNSLAVGAEVLGAEADGNPVFTSHSYGKGKVFFLACPIELSLVSRPGAFTNEPAWMLYHHIMQSLPVSAKRVATRQSPAIGITEHPLDDSRRIVVLINYHPEEVTDRIILKSNWIIRRTLYGGANLTNVTEATLTLPANDAIVMEIETA